MHVQGRRTVSEAFYSLISFNYVQIRWRHRTGGGRRCGELAANQPPDRGSPGPGHGWSSGAEAAAAGHPRPPGQELRRAAAGCSLPPLRRRRGGSGPPALPPRGLRAPAPRTAASAGAAGNSGRTMARPAPPRRLTAAPPRRTRPPRRRPSSGGGGGGRRLPPRPAAGHPAAGKARPSGGVAGRAGAGARGNRAVAPGCSLTTARSWSCTGTRPPAAAAPAPGPPSPPSAILRARDAAGDAVTARKEPPPSPGRCAAPRRVATAARPWQRPGLAPRRRRPPCAHAPWRRAVPGWAAVRGRPAGRAAVRPVLGAAGRRRRVTEGERCPAVEGREGRRGERRRRGPARSGALWGAGEARTPPAAPPASRGRPRQSASPGSVGSGRKRKLGWSCPQSYMDEVPLRALQTAECGCLLRALL